jgi:hypothetical protein
MLFQTYGFTYALLDNYSARQLKYIKYVKFRFWSSGLWRHVVLQLVTNVSKEHTVSIFGSTLKMDTYATPEHW